MKTVGLVICLVILAWAGWTIIVQGFGSLAFNWQDLLFYLGAALIVYLIVRAVGGALDNKFNASVKAFLDGEQASPLEDRGLLRTFGFLLIVLLPFLLYLLALAFYSATTFAFYGLWLISIIERVPVAVVVGLIIVVIGTAIGVILGLYYLLHPPRRKTLGIEIGKDKERRLWGIVGEIAAALKARPINKIIVTPDPGIGVYLEGNVFWTVAGGGRRVLEIGLPSLHKLTVDEFKSILAHEYGHFSNRDTQWSSFTYSMGTSLVSAFQSVPGPPRDGGNRGCGIVGAIMSINPAYWILYVFVHLYFRITNGFSRIREVMADVMAMTLYGGQAFVNGLEKVVTNDAVFINIVHGRYVPQLLKEKKMITDFSKAMESVYGQLDEAKIKEMREGVLAKSTQASTYDSHPPLSVRLDYARRFGSSMMKDDRPVSTIFKSWAELNEAAAKLYNMRLMQFMRMRGGY
jgi:Zn-dependent protease with chaperone function